MHVSYIIHNHVQTYIPEVTFFLGFNATARNFPRQKSQKKKTASEYVTREKLPQEEMVISKIYIVLG